ncbi:MAG: hypothetical protein IKK69_05235 [Firmicutes bacterium]|nr:hypothetical protein [Bacillota bacterium]
MKKNVLKENNIIAAAAMFFAAVMVAFPAITEAGAKSAISIWLNSVVPVLLPFFIFADFIKRTADMERLPVKVYPLVMAFLSGYPMGAKIVGDMVKQGVLTGSEGRYVLSYSLVTGPAFILGTVGAFLGSSQAAAIVAIGHYAGAVCNGMMWKSDIVVKSRNITTKQRRENNLDCFTDAILAGFRAMAIILAYLILFMIGADLLEMVGLLDLLPGEHWRSFAKGLIEMTVGTCALGMCNINLRLKTVLTAFIISFGGLSVIGQSLSVSGGGWLGLTELIKIKITHGLLAGTIAALLGLILL